MIAIKLKKSAKFYKKGKKKEKKKSKLLIQGTLFRSLEQQHSNPFKVIYNLV